MEGATFGERGLSANPENAPLQACESSCSFRTGLVTIPSFVILHARLGDEWLPAREHAHDIGQVLMGVVLKRVANGEWCVLGDRQPILRGKLCVNVPTRVVPLQRMAVTP